MRYPARATRIACRNALSAQRAKASAVAETSPTRTVTAASAKNPPFSAVTSSFTRSPSPRTRSPGTPWTTSSLTLMQAAPGKPYTFFGAATASFSANTRAHTASSCAVVTPGSTAADMAFSASRTILPTIRNCSSSRSDSIDMAPQIRVATTASILHLPSIARVLQQLAQRRFVLLSLQFPLVACWFGPCRRWTPDRGAERLRLALLRWHFSLRASDPLLERVLDTDSNLNAPPPPSRNYR